MENFLTANAVFVCTAGGMIRCKDSGNKTVRHKGAELLTTGATMNSKTGTCTILTAMAQGTPQPCKCQLTTWLPGFSPMKTSNGNSLLTDSAKNICAIGGTVSVKASGVFDKITNGTAPSAMTLTTSKLVETVADKKSSDSQRTIQSYTKDVADEKISLADKNSAPQKFNEEVSFKCPACKNSSTCEYAMRGSVKEHLLPPIVREKDSADSANNDNELKKNYFQYLEETAGIAGVRKSLSEMFKSKLGDLEFYRQLAAKFRTKGNAADRNFLTSLCRQLEIIQRDKKIPWGYQAHHLIPINEVFAEFPNSLLVANLGKFDSADESRRVFNINCAENCIMLLSYNRDKRFDTFIDRLQKRFGKLREKFFNTKEENETFELMKVVEREHEFKIQWHVGGHTYSFKKSEVVELSAMLREKIAQSNLIDYKTAVCNRMLDIEDEIDLKNLCPKKFHEDILTLAADIRKHLSDFSQDPCKSYPFFVTKSNYYYALTEDF